MISTKLTVGLSMLEEARIGEFNDATSVLSKILGNIVANPTEAKYRKLRVSNAKIGAMLATRGVRAILIGAGFVEEGDFLVLPEATEVTGVESAIAGVAAQAEARAGADASRKAEEAALRKAKEDKENEERKRMREGIQDDAAARKEPGWKPKAAGVKGGRAITGCSDVGIGCDSGG